ncbi:MAG TPA: helix-turn-helix transcriptional regulator [Elusimicrobiales bacterium]|nr:helix-turn-helix transcriptional regulator [Elusimicrobiales bacterium]
MDKNIYLAMGTAVRSRRLAHGWSQEELGERSGLHPSYIGQIERGTKKISLETLRKISLALKAKISDLLSEPPVKYTPSSWEGKIAGILRDRPVEQQKRAYRIIRETLRPYKTGKK